MSLNLATAAIFILTYAGVAIGRFPGLRLDRAGIALTGAAFTVAVGAISPEEAYRAIDLDTLALLLGMMIIVGRLQLSGFFRLAARWALAHAHSQPVLLDAVASAAALLSAFLVDDAVCLVMAPLVIETTRTLRRDPVPYSWPSQWPPASAARRRSPSIRRTRSSARSRASPTRSSLRPWRRRRCSAQRSSSFSWPLSRRVSSCPFAASAPAAPRRASTSRR
jgi:hypothetical protein